MPEAQCSMEVAARGSYTLRVWGGKATAPQNDQKRLCGEHVTGSILSGCSGGEDSPQGEEKVKNSVKMSHEWTMERKPACLGAECGKEPCACSVHAGWGPGLWRKNKTEAGAECST